MLKYVEVKIPNAASATTPWLSPQEAWTNDSMAWSWSPTFNLRHGCDGRGQWGKTTPTRGGYLMGYHGIIWKQHRHCMTFLEFSRYDYVIWVCLNMLGKPPIFPIINYS
jgi:hypothetical protein